MRGVMGIGLSVGVLVLAACGGVSDPGEPTGAGVGVDRPDSTRAEPADGSDNDDSAETPDMPVGSGTIPSFGSGGVAGSGGGSALPYGSEGGATETPSDGGAPNEPSRCDSPVTGSLAKWVPREPDLDQSVSAVLTQARAVLTGSWHGVVTTQWKDPYAIVATFGADGSYSARCVENSDYAGGEGCCRALYSGSDRDSDLKLWSFDSVDESGLVSGELDVAFCYDVEPCYSPGWQGIIKKFEYDATENRVRIEFWRGEYGPHEIELERD